MLKRTRNFIVKLILTPVMIVVIIIGAAAITAKNAHANEPAFKEQIEAGTNIYRSSQGLAPLHHDEFLASIAQSWANHLAANSEYFHNPNLAGQVFADESFFAYGENLVAQRVDGNEALQSWIGSEGHRLNLVGNFNRQGVGVAYGGNLGITYVQVLALKESPPAPQPSQPASPPAPEPTPQPATPSAPSVPEQVSQPATSPAPTVSGGSSPASPSTAGTAGDSASSDSTRPTPKRIYLNEFVRNSGDGGHGIKTVSAPAIASQTAEQEDSNHFLLLGLLIPLVAVGALVFVARSVMSAEKNSG